MHRAPCAALLAAVVLSGLGACGDDGDTPSASTPATATTDTSGAGSSTTAAPTTATTGATPSTSPPATEPTDDLPDSIESGRSELEDGRHFGFWRSFEIGDTVAFGEFDLAFFLTGAQAEAAAAERGDEVNNDYYVVNDNPRLRTLVARGDTEVLVLASVGGPAAVSTNVADFAVDRHEGSGFFVTIEDGIVTRIEEQFVP
jgi:hypothetical protein